MGKKKHAPALKHGGYSLATLLPGDDPAAYKKLHNALIAELCPNGALEQDIVTSIARLLSRKHHLASFRVVGSAQDEKITSRDKIDPDAAMKLYQKILDEKPKLEEYGNKEYDNIGAEELMKRYQEMIREKPISREQSFFKAGEIAKLEQFMDVLAVEERLDAMIDRCLKRLLFLRGLKSLSPTNPSVAATLPKTLS